MIDDSLDYFLSREEKTSLSLVDYLDPPECTLLKCPQCMATTGAPEPMIFPIYPDVS